MKNNHTKEQLKYLQSLSLKEKIQISTARIIEWYENWGGQVYVSFSGGKDSTVLLDLVRKIYPNVKAVFCDTGLEYPEIKEFVRAFNNVEWLKPKMTFTEVLTKYGYPFPTKEQAAFIQEYSTTKSEKLKNIRINGNRYGRGKISNRWKIFLDSEFKVSDKCCDIMKKNPAKDFEKRTGLKPYIGTQTLESKQRESNWIKYGCNGFNMKRPQSKPLSFWTEQDILRYIYINNLSTCSVYGQIMVNENGTLHFSKCQRTGCVFCGFGCHLEKEPNRFQHLKETHPQLYDYCMRGGKYTEDGKWIPDKGLGMKKILDFIGVKYE